MNRALVVETCCEEKINANLLSKSQLLPAEVRETEQTTLNLIDEGFSKVGCGKHSGCEKHRILPSFQSAFFQLSHFSCLYT